MLLFACVRCVRWKIYLLFSGVEVVSRVCDWRNVLFCFLGGGEIRVSAVAGWGRSGGAQVPVRLIENAEK